MMRCLLSSLGRRAAPQRSLLSSVVRVTETVPAAPSSSSSEAPVRVITRDALGRAYGTGRRKTSSARVWVFPGDGTVTINGKNLIEYFVRKSLVDEIVKPFGVTRTACDFDVKATVKGGGLSGQAGAIRHGIARALQNYDPAHRPALKKAGFITRDPRMVERKKPGRKKARKAFQWVKR